MVMKYSKQKNDFNTKDLKIDKNNFQYYSIVLHQHMSDLFPSELETKKIMAKVKPSNLSNNVYTKENLPSHINDKRWLTRYLMQFIAEYNSDDVEKQIFISKQIEKLNRNFENTHPAYKTELEENNAQTIYEYKQSKPRLASVRSFVETDPKFNNELKLYQIKMVETQIDLMLENNEPKSEPEAYNAEEHFRENLFFTLYNFYNIDTNILKTTYEKNIKYWQEPIMNKMFYSRYNLTNKISDYNNWLSAYKEREKFKPTWEKAFKYHYYQTYKTDIDRAGMTKFYPQLNQEEAKKLDQVVTNWNELFQSIIKQKTNNLIK